MDILQELGVALGLASLAGVNLYLTVFLTGLVIRFDLLHLAEKYQSLEVLGHPAVIAVAGVLFVMQFFADKVPWVDTLWDSVHTVIRPVGGTLLALVALGEMSPWVKVVAALLAGGAALTTHGAKAGTRLLINHSPEPISNIGMSLLEEAAVVGGVVLTLMKPVLALIVFASLIVLIWMLFPRLWRIIRSTIWLAWHKLKMPGRRVPLDKPVELKLELPEETRDILRYRAGLSETDLLWSVRSLSGKVKGVRGLSPNLDGLLIAPSRPDSLYFAAGKGFRDRLFKVPLGSVQVEMESRFLSENVMLTGPGLRAVFRFPRGQADVAQTVALRLREILSQPAAPVGHVEPEVPAEEVHAPIPPPAVPISVPEVMPVAKIPSEEKLVPFPAVSS
jgi:hypothetical protein